MLNYKDFAEIILSDLMNDVSLSDILLKTKIFASKKGDKELLAWLERELVGYDDAPPAYRVLNCGLKVDVFVPFRGMVRIDFPVDMIDNEVVKNRLSKLAIHMPIAEIEKLCKPASDNGMISMKTPVVAYPYIKEYINGEIQDSYQYTTTAAVSQVLVSIKSLLIDFLLRVSKEESIDFNNFIKTIHNKDNITIHAGIVNTGSGDVYAQGSTNIIANSISISAEDKKALLEILAEIDKIAEAQPNSEYEEVSAEIKKELRDTHPHKNLLKRCFQAIPSILTNIGAGIVANQLTPLVESAIALL